MADFIRPDLRLPISDPNYFFGRRGLLSAVERSPFQVRILLGGRRLGKTSVLNALQNQLLRGSNLNYRGFPVLFNLQQERPENLDHFRYLLIARLQEAVTEYKEGSVPNWRKGYRRLLRQISGGSISVGLPKMSVSLNVTNPDSERRLINEDFRQDLLNILKWLQRHKFTGVCFLLDGAEFIVSQDWANDAWSYLRALKDTDTALKPFVGFVFSGYRDLRDYQQKVGSPLLNIAEVEWLKVLSEEETRSLISYRSQVENFAITDEIIDRVIFWGGCHPYFTQQILNTLFDEQNLEKSRTPENLMNFLLREHDRDFLNWWDKEKRSYGFSQIEQVVYLQLVKQEIATVETLAQQTNFTVGEVADALEVLTGAGVIRQLDDEQYEMGAKLFEEWVVREKE